MLEIQFKVLVVLVVFLAAGCSTIPHQVDLLYKPVSAIGGGNGKISLIVTDSACSHEKTQVRWVYGNIKNDDGSNLDEIVSPILPRDLVGDAFKQELESAGFSVDLDRPSTSSAEDRQVRLSAIRISLSETPSFFKITSTARITVSMELLNSGKMIKKEEYESSYTDTYSRVQEQQVQSVLQKALEGVVTKAAPDIVQHFRK